MNIGGHLKSSFIDYPDKISTVFFTRGCNFRCPYCHNSALVLGTEENVEMDYIEQFLRERKKYLDGIVVSGGEPTIQQDLPDFLSWLQAFGLPVKLDTNGSNPRMLEVLLKKGLVDYVAMDIKAPLAKVGNLAGVMVSLSDVRSSIDLLMQGETDYEFRTTVAKELLSLEDLYALALEIQGAKRYVLQRFRDNEEVLAGPGLFSAYTLEEMRQLQERIDPYLEQVLLR